MSNLEEAYRSGRLILFVGAGVSATLGLPTWSELIAKIARELEYDESVFSTYGTALSLAEYYKIKTGSIGPLRSWMDREWHRDSIDILNSEVHSLIAKGNFPRIYTTNYDRWLENAHIKNNVAFDKIANVSDLVKSDDSKRHIVKFHGDFDDDASIVLDETSYFERLTFESPLDIRLRSEVLGRSVLFIGYSISDWNVRLMFHKLTKIWNEHSIPSARPRSYLFTNKYNPVADEILKTWGIDMIVSDIDDQKEALTDFVRKLTE